MKIFKYFLFISMALLTTIQSTPSFSNDAKDMNYEYKNFYSDNLWNITKIYFKKNYFACDARFIGRSANSNGVVGISVVKTNMVFISFKRGIFPIRKEEKSISGSLVSGDINENKNILRTTANTDIIIFKMPEIKEVISRRTATIIISEKNFVLDFTSLQNIFSHLEKCSTETQ